MDFVVCCDTIKSMDIVSILLLIGLAVVAFFLWQIYSGIKRLSDDKLQLDQEATKSLVNQVFGEVTNKVAQQTKGILDTDKQAIYKDNENKRQAIEQLVHELKKEIGDRQKEIRSLEQDRNKKFGEISTAIEEHRKLTQELKTTTETLSKVLSNNQVRGQWGERIIEDILRHAGLIEEVHFERQKSLGTSSVKPDITLILPNQRRVCIDVKFPYAEVQKMALAETKAKKMEHMKTFARDLKNKIKEIETRGYINIEHGTLDYAIMFVPNEMLFSFINQEYPDIIDEAMSKKIMLVSPFTFLIVARTVMESYRNFMIENNLRKIISHIGDFINEWDRFTKEFDRFGDSITKMESAFAQITTTRYKQMNLRIRRIREESQGNQLEQNNTNLLDK